MTIIKKTRNFHSPWHRTPGRIFGIILIRSYQLTLSSLTGAHCRHIPTCSEYTYEAIARHGLWSGSCLGFLRLIRCGPCGTYGFDPVPITLGSSYSWYTPWRYLLGKNRDHPKT
ncbi:MAG: hypothetical protein JSC085_000552 [Candidatus Tokpelaia sp. JSC085]|nr:MAG: hypothetical protein JSC085_000552 [Candidatus Tokpelaia sp. JSC085]